jgi:hypothetical protein
MTTPPRFTRPAIYWTITRDKKTGLFVSMRVTHVTPDRVYGGIGEKGRFRAHNEVFGKFPTFNEASRHAGELNFQLALARSRINSIQDQIDLLTGAICQVNDQCATIIDAMTSAFPRVGMIANAYSRD